VKECLDLSLNLHLLALSLCSHNPPSHPSVSLNSQFSMKGGSQAAGTIAHNTPFPPWLEFHLDAKAQDKEGVSAKPFFYVA